MNGIRTINLKFPEWQYTYGQGETRIGKNRKVKKEEKKDNKDNEDKEGNENKDTDTHIKASHEIFIIDWPKTK